MELPLVPSCELDAGGLKAQRERYRAAGEGATVLERTARRLVVEVSPQAVSAVSNLVEVERECCPFFQIDWDSSLGRLSFGVSDAEHEPALDAIAYALGA
jgi:hypothetical protein